MQLTWFTIIRIFHISYTDIVRSLVVAIRRKSEECPNNVRIIIAKISRLCWRRLTGFPDLGVSKRRGKSTSVI